MEASLASKYQRLRSGGRSLPVPGEGELAALWGGALVRQPLRTGDGRRVTVLQAGLPEARGALRFVEAALRFDEGPVKVGVVEIGETVARGEMPLLTVIWNGEERGTGAQALVALATQLPAPWAEMADLVELPAPAEGSSSLREEAPLPSGDALSVRLLDLLRAAGLYRLGRRTRRIGLRLAAVGRTQALWELLAEALGYHRNQEPFRHLARRLPVSFLEPLAEGERTALLFGVAGFLPAGDFRGIPPQAQAAARPLWDRWWKARGALDYTVLPAGAWSFRQIRPANRPERRLAALAQLVPHLARLERAIDRRDAAAFARVLAECHDPFWSRQATWKSRPSPKPIQLIGGERIDDLVVNLFWPLVALDDPAAAEAAWNDLPGADNRVLRAARERLPAEFTPGRSLRSSLLQQGLLQLDRDTRETGLGRMLAGW